MVIGHSAYLKITTTFGGVDYLLPENISQAYNSGFLGFCRYLSGWAYGFHMPLFFILSGAVLGLREIAPFDKFCVSKIRRLLVPYFIYGWFFMLSVKFIGNFYDKTSLLQAMRGFLSGVDSGHLWFLTALFWCMLVFAILQKIVGRYTNSVYLLLALAEVIQLTYGYLPFDVLGLKTGLSYIFWFALGYVFEYERKRHVPLNMRKTVFAFVVMFVLEALNKRYGILDSFFTILCGSFFTFLMADVCSRIFKKVTSTKGWGILVRNLFYVYLFHDPLEYVILRIFMDGELLSHAWGCYIYTFCRIVLIFAVSVALGECVRWLRGVRLLDVLIGTFGKKD